MDLTQYLEPGIFVDSDAPTIFEFSARVCGGETDDVAKAVCLYYAVRDRIVYTPYFDFRSEDAYRASACLASGAGFCVSKAALLAAAARSAGTPARVAYADVRNHLCTRKLRALMGTDIFYYHSYVELYLQGKWVKATPAFDRALCDRFGVRPLEFDGRADPLLHPFDQHGRRHMEYLRDRGPSADVPVADIIATFAREYPRFGRSQAAIAANEFREEAARASRRKGRRQRLA